MDERTFWSIIERNRGDAVAIRKQLSKRSLEEIAAWHRMYYDHHDGLHRGALWDVLDIVFHHAFGGPAGMDSFHYFKAWVIGKGRRAYETALAEPDAMGAFFTRRDLEDGCENEALNYAAEDAWETRGGDRDDLERASNEFTEPIGDRCPPEDLRNRFPRLVERFRTGGK